MKKRQSYIRRKEDILKFREDGLSYKEISAKIGCSLSTISYHCGKNNSEKSRVVSQKTSALCKKVGHFRSRCTADAYRLFRNKIKGFREKSKRRTYGRVNSINKPYNCKDVIRKVGDSPVCYLTGRKININESSTYHLDHIVPTHKGGSNDLSNMGISCAEANQAKGALNLEDFYSLCEEILSWRNKVDK